MENFFLCVVNFNKKSKDYLKFKTWIFCHKENKSILIPPLYANGHLCLSDSCVFHYKMSYLGSYPDVKDQVSIDRIKIVAQERITEELNKIILSKRPSSGFKLLEETGLLKIIFPEFQLLKGIENINGKSHKDNFYHTLKVLDNIKKQCFRYFIIFFF